MNESENKKWKNKVFGFQKNVWKNTSKIFRLDMNELSIDNYSIYKNKI